MLLSRGVFFGLGSVLVSACVVAPCPQGVTCGVAPNTGGATGAGGGGNSGDPGGGSGPMADPVPTGKWINATGNLAGMVSECGTISHISVKPDEDVLLTTVAAHGVWSSKDHGASWQQIGIGKGSAQVKNRSSAIIFDPQDPTIWWESGIYNGQGIFQTKDNGSTFLPLGDIQNNDLVAIDFSDPARKTLVAGGHESERTLFKSTNGGMTWASIGKDLPAATNCVNPLILDASTFVVGCGGYGGGKRGVYKTTDSGDTWTSMIDHGGANAPLVASDGSIYWTSLDSAGVVRSTDNGDTWKLVTPGGVVNEVPPVELADGRIAAVGQKYIMISSDQGASFHPGSSEMPIKPYGLTYSPHENALYAYWSPCGNEAVPVADDAIMRYDLDQDQDGGAQ